MAEVVGASECGGAFSRLDQLPPLKVEEQVDVLHPEGEKAEEEDSCQSPRRKRAKLPQPQRMTKATGMCDVREKEGGEEDKAVEELFGGEDFPVPQVVVNKHRNQLGALWKRMCLLKGVLSCASALFAARTTNWRSALLSVCLSVCSLKPCHTPPLPLQLVIPHVSDPGTCDLGKSLLVLVSSFFSG